MKWIGCLLFLVACGPSGPPSLGDYAVGTYFGGGSWLTGPSGCSYSGEPQVFAPSREGLPSTTLAPGPRLIIGAGKIDAACPAGRSVARAVEPTGAAITGPKRVKLGAKSDLFMAGLVAGGRSLDGRANIAWELGPDCAGVAAFGPVLGSSDTGGADRSRALEPAAKGKCTVKVALTTGSVLEPSFAAKVFRAEQVVTVE